MTGRTSFLCAALHERTSMYELDAKFYLEQLSKEESGFSPDTLSMLRLSSDIGALRQLADAFERIGKQLTAPKMELQDAP